VLRSHRIAVGLYDRADAGLVRRLRIETDVAGPRTIVPELAGQPRPDLVLVNDEDLSYAKIRLDEHSLGTLVDHIAEFTDSLPAALCWSAAWDMCRDAEMAARDYVRLVLSGVSSVADISVVQTLLRQAGQAVRRFADPGWRRDGLELTARVLHGLLDQAAPGSDQQLAYVRAFAGVATAGDDLAMLAGLLDGSVTLDGLTVDTELRWALLARLVSRGYAGPDAIDAELARDATDAGERHAAACRAAIPAPEAKQAAWDSMLSGELTLAMFRAVLSGFADPDQPELVNPYREKYFAVIGEVWRTWSSAMAQDFVSGAYTAGAISEQTVRLTDDYIAAADPPAALRRLLTEGRDDVLRALRCQARDRLSGV
jgi:aminopeptidase N